MDENHKIITSLDMSNINVMSCLDDLSLEKFNSCYLRKFFGRVEVTYTSFHPTGHKIGPKLKALEHSQPVL